MQELFKFPVKVDKKNKTVFVAKPKNSDKEAAEFVRAQKFNILLNQGFLSKAMMYKKFGDIGGIHSEQSSEELKDAILDLLESKKTIEFLGSKEDLDDGQKSRLEEAEKTYGLLQKQIIEKDNMLKDMFAQSADTKADEHMIKWYVLNCSYYYDQAGDSTDSFKMFDKSKFQEKEEQLNLYLDDIQESDSADLKMHKELVQGSLGELNKIVAIWYNGLGSNQKDIQHSLEELFPEDHPPAKHAAPKKKRARKVKEVDSE